jgi:hypothetical protein
MEDKNICKCLTEEEYKEYVEVKKISNKLGNIPKIYLNELGIETLRKSDKRISELNTLKNSNRYDEKIMYDDIEVKFCDDDQGLTVLRIYPNYRIVLLTDFRGKENIDYLIDFCKYAREELINKNIILFSKLSNKIIIQRDGLSIKFKKIDLYLRKVYENFEWKKVKK